MNREELEWQIRDIRLAAESALKALESINPACRDFRHLGDDRHRVGEECKPLTRYREITETLRKALGK